MLGVNQLDFINYCNALKGNYRKGVHKMETLLENPTHAKEFASNLGGVSVVLGTPVGKEDRNSETLRSMLLNSDVANDAVYTWMGQFYEFSSWDELLSDEDRCKAMMANELMWRALSASGVAMGKTVATLAGLSCSAYADMGAVAASSTAMAAVASSQTAMAAVAASASAIRAMVASTAAKTALIANNNNLQSVANTWWKTVQSGFTLVRSQKDDDGVTSANSVNAKYIMFAIPGGYNNGSGITNCFHGHNGAAAGSASGSYTDTAKRKVLLGGGTFTETNDGMVRTWVYSI